MSHNEPLSSLPQSDIAVQFLLLGEWIHLHPPEERSLKGSAMEAQKSMGCAPIFGAQMTAMIGVCAEKDKGQEKAREGNERDLQYMSENRRLAHGEAG